MKRTERLSEIADIRPGYLSRKAIDPSESGSHCVIQVGDFNRERTDLRAGALVRFTPEPIASVEPVRCGEVLFLAKGVHNFAYAVGDLPKPTLAASYFFVLRPRTGILPAYLQWFLNQESTRRVFSRFSGSGVRVPVVTRRVLENIEIPVPPIPTQKNIVELADLMREEARLMSELSRKKQEMVSRACMKSACGS